jgi:hypothetical protein
MLLSRIIRKSLHLGHRGIWSKKPLEGKDQSLIATGLFVVGLYMGAVMFGPEKEKRTSETLSDMKACFRGQKKWDYLGRDRPREGP